jgi:hypothetical protein
MKTLLEILRISSIGEKEKKVSQGLRDEAVQENASDELSESKENGICDTLDALRGERIEKNHLPAKRTNRFFPPIWAIGFACIISVLFISFLMRENTPSLPASSSVSPEAMVSSNQKPNAFDWIDEPLTFDTPPFADSFSLPSDAWLANLKVNPLHATTPIHSIASIYDELSRPTLPHFELPAFSDPTMILYKEEGKRIRNDLQNGLGFLFESLHSLDFQIEG